MIRIAITPEAFEAIAATLALGSVGYEAQTNAKGERLVWLEAAVVDRLASMRGTGESYSDVILRLCVGKTGDSTRSLIVISALQDFESLCARLTRNAIDQPMVPSDASRPPSA